jgi:hypothetical protein
MTTKYQDSIAILQQRVELFRKGVESCNIENMLDSNVSLIETLKHANNIYASLPPKEKKIEENTLNKSKDLVNNYFHIKSGIGNTCKCQLLDHRV